MITRRYFDNNSWGARDLQRAADADYRRRVATHRVAGVFDDTPDADDVVATLESRAKAGDVHAARILASLTK